jgi:hypothetical protein
MTETIYLLLLLTGLKDDEYPLWYDMNIAFVLIYCVGQACICRWKREQQTLLDPSKRQSGLSSLSLSWLKPRTELNHKPGCFDSGAVYGRRLIVKGWFIATGNAVYLSVT